MLARLRTRITYANVVSSLALFIALGGGTFAAVRGIPGSDGRIHACFNKKSGAVRIVAERKRCRRGEQTLAWSQRGPVGPAGATGSAGETGPAGAPNPNATNSDRLDNLDSTDFARKVSDVGAPAQEGHVKLGGELHAGMVRAQNVVTGGIDLADNLLVPNPRLSMGASGAIASARWHNFIRTVPGTSLPADTDAFQTRGGRLLITVSGSARRTAAQGTGVGEVDITLNRATTGGPVVVGAFNIRFAFNLTDTHFTIPTRSAEFETEEAVHFVTISSDATEPVTTDVNDPFHVTITELPF